MARQPPQKLSRLVEQVENAQWPVAGDIVIFADGSTRVILSAIPDGPYRIAGPIEMAYPEGAKFGVQDPNDPGKILIGAGLPSDLPPLIVDYVDHLDFPEPVGKDMGPPIAILRGNNAKRLWVPNEREPH